MRTNVTILALDGCFDTGFAVLLDTLETANALSSLSTPPFHVVIAGVRRRPRTHHGLAIDAAAMPAKAPDLVVMPALACKQPDEILQALERRDVGDAMNVVRSWRARGTRLAAACTSTFVLAQSGTLDGKRATTSWWLGPTFRRAFPAVELDDTQMVVADKGVVTAGAAFAHVDLALSLVRDRSPSLASAVAKHLVLDDRASQAPYVAADFVAHDDELVKKLERYVRRHIAEPFDLADVARAIGASERTLQRRVSAVLGKPPIAFVQELRLERAAHLLRSTHKSVDDVARDVGYESATTLRTLLRKKLGVGVRAIRRGAR
ncbi:MAG TPA: helix-turn-helix domain-containing protein [Myxococcota bacterium]|jgi:transcriptional regulator GlxA family with amidase domain